MPILTFLAERLLATDSVAEAQAIAEELQVAVRDHLERVRQEARLLDRYIYPSARDDSSE